MPDNAVTQLSFRSGKSDPPCQLPRMMPSRSEREFRRYSFAQALLQGSTKQCGIGERLTTGPLASIAAEVLLMFHLELLEDTPVLRSHLQKQVGKG
jgi:hypothetical protein